MQPSRTMNRNALTLSALLLCLPGLAQAQVACGLLGEDDHNQVTLRFGTTHIAPDEENTMDLWIAESGLSYGRVLPSPITDEEGGRALLDLRIDSGREDRRDQEDGSLDGSYVRVGAGYAIEHRFSGSPMISNLAVCGGGRLEAGFHAGSYLPEHHLAVPVGVQLAYSLKKGGFAAAPFVHPTMAFYRQVVGGTTEEGDSFRDTNVGRDFQLAAGLAMRISHLIVSGAYRISDAAVGEAPQIVVTAGVAF